MTLRTARRPAPKLALLCLICAASLSWTAQARAFSLDEVTAQARALMNKPYVAPVNNLPPEFSGMQFADYQKMQPRTDRFEWSDLKTPFRLGFYHQGMQFNSAVRINEITADGVQEIKYDPERFDFGGLAFDKTATRQLGYAGFRLLYPVNQPDKLDEIVSFLGASYFRVIGKGQVYGLSSRGLAIDTAPPGGEEFPNFREFWIQRPAPEDRQVVIYALLDSPRATGAYQFIVTPAGKDAVVDVQANIFVRGDIKTLGIAPLTSMFLYGPNQQSELRRNFRPAIHDSNGLAIHTGGGEWLWRPLNNPRQLAISSFEVENPKGFGLLQRGREFSRYEDLKDRYDLRPSAWIEPHGNWGKGRVTLMEIPTPDETNDNIVAFWTPAAPTQRGQMLQFAYRMHWTTDEPALHGADNAWVKQTFHTDNEELQANLIRRIDGSSSAFLIDFEGPALAGLSNGADIKPQVSVGDNAELLGVGIERNPAIKGWRVALRVKVKDPALPVEMRAALVQGDKAISETWSYQLPPNPPPAPAAAAPAAR
ncbi:glucan biosynthesis protein G [Variovorax saccharolyticus]|uniref:glucan biosynthesis protein G n=1 Tax=Variovorax saccharolyticus TaxID=3053516 RepID=UPI002578639A|nr:glucan biosynthesis protein G [Variovorax sp. J22R187]MDM0022773.1 glucan biosynthesis protein G [Variovorax sp. J22R187]